VSASFRALLEENPEAESAVATETVDPAAVGADTKKPIIITSNGQVTPALANEWWQWALSLPKSDHPLFDITGTYCGNGQRGPTWFLGGSFASATADRTCQIPWGHNILIPILNAVTSTVEECKGEPAGCSRTPNELKQCSVSFTGTWVNKESLVATLDGRPWPLIQRVSSSVITSPVVKTFPVFLPPGNNVLDLPPSQTPNPGPAWADGYWVFIPYKSLPATTTHKLRVAGSASVPARGPGGCNCPPGANPSGCAGFDFAIDVAYTISVTNKNYLPGK
jgi:hypothetical protein